MSTTRQYTELNDLPCKDQTFKQVKEWVIKTGLKQGDTVALRRTHNYICYTYFLSNVEAVTSNGRIVIKNYGSFYKNGKNCFHPKGQLQMIEPKPEVIEAADNKYFYSPF